MNLSPLVRPGTRWLFNCPPSPSCPAIVCRRYESSYRRTKKKLRVKPDASFLTSPTSPQQDHIVFNPPSSAPSVYHTPSKFLPKDDRRRELFSALSDTSDALSQTNLPPPVRTPYEKKYHLVEKDFEEIRRLRREDPEEWSKEKLAKKFECSALFVGIVCQATKQRKEEQKQMLEAVKSRWGRRRRTAREDRTRRRESWGREE